MSAGEVKCWGLNDHGQLGDGTTTDRLVPTAVSGLGTSGSYVFAGSGHTCAGVSGLGVECWGLNDHGQLGDGTTTDRLTPVAVSGSGGFYDLTAGTSHTCASEAHVGVLCWGSNAHGELGDGTTTDRATPVVVSGLGYLSGDVNQLAAGNDFTCAVAGGAAVCWGGNEFGQLGDGTTIDSTTPVTVSGLSSGVDYIAAGFGHACAIVNNLSGMKCWGLNDHGQLGDGTTVNSSTPVDVLAGTPAPPVVNLSASPSPVLSGNQVQLDASAYVPNGTVADYQWDLGSGVFTRDTGTTPTTTTSFASGGNKQVRVKVTNNGGQSTIATATVDVRPTAPPGRVGVSIDNGDYATNNAHVHLDVVWPAYASQAVVWNDSGFGSGGPTKTLPIARTLGWKLAVSGNERFPKIVHVRFPDSQSPAEIVTDKIILDTSTPQIEGASFAGAARTTSAWSGRSVYGVWLRASEKVSGISKVQFSNRRHPDITVVLTNRKRRGILHLSKVVRVGSATRPVWVRVQSSAGNWSKWHRIR
jgi:hypothetical protein